MTEVQETVSSTFHPASAPDYVPAPLLRDLQLKRLQAVVRRAYEHVELFRQRLDERHVRPDDIRSLSDIARLPFTVKTDLRDTYPFGLSPAHSRRSSACMPQAGPRANPSWSPTPRGILTSGPTS